MSKHNPYEPSITLSEWTKRAAQRPSFLDEIAEDIMNASAIESVLAQNYKPTTWYKRLYEKWTARINDAWKCLRGTHYATDE